jgi:hypothetical protein
MFLGMLPAVRVLSVVFRCEGRCQRETSHDRVTRRGLLPQWFCRECGHGFVSADSVPLRYLRPRRRRETAKRP